MALFLVLTRKATQLFGGRKWTNRYFVEASDEAAALDHAVDIWQNYERTVHYQDVYCYEVYANNTADPANSIGATRPVSPAIQRGGLNSAGAGNLLPDHNVVRVDFPVVASRPSRKFYRVPLFTNDVNANALVGGVLGAMVGSMGALASRPYMRDEDGQLWVGGALVRGITSRRMGKFAALGVPNGPPLG